MIVVDTNVVSEPMRPAANPAVTRWLDREAATGRLFLTATSLGELLSGMAKMPVGRRRAELETKLDVELRTRFQGRVLAFDEVAARAYVSITERAKTRGIAIAIADGQIAAIAETQGMIVATRDVKPFRGLGLRVINPWEEA